MASWDPFSTQTRSFIVIHGIHGVHVHVLRFSVASHGVGSQMALRPTVDFSSRLGPSPRGPFYECPTSCALSKPPGVWRTQQRTTRVTEHPFGRSYLPKAQYRLRCRRHSQHLSIPHVSIVLNNAILRARASRDVLPDFHETRSNKNCVHT